MLHVLFLVHLLLKMFKLYCFCIKLPIPSIEKKATKWVQGAPTPIQEGQLTPISEALNLLAGFSSGEVIMEGEELKHIPSISESLESIWDTPKRKNTDGRANRTNCTKRASYEYFLTVGHFKTSHKSTRF